jgi:predicted DNA-binding transcriptional regulator YafY
MARGDQLSRQWKIIQTLMAATRGRSAAELADEHGCHSRTAYRDLEALQQAGFPLYTDKDDHRTLWSILESGKRHLPIPFNLTELMALYFSRNMLLKLLEGTALSESLDALFQKVKATLPPEYLNYLGKMGHSLEVGVKARKPYHRFQHTLTRVQEAVQNRRYIKIRYFTMSRRKMSQRRVAPYKVWFYDETFYLIGHCCQRNAIRLFAIERIEGIEALDDVFEIPEGFDAEAYMHASFGVFQGDPVTITVRFAPGAAGYIQEKIWHPTQKISPQPDGGLLFQAEVAGLEEIKWWVLRWGAGAQVISPPELRQMVSREVDAMAAAYAGKEPAP